MNYLHGGLTFGPLSPPSRDGICMPKQVWSTFFLFEIFDHMINSLRIRRLGPYSNSSNMQVWSTSNRKSGPNLRIRTDLMQRDHKLFKGGKKYFYRKYWISFWLLIISCNCGRWLSSWFHFWLCGQFCRLRWLLWSRFWSRFWSLSINWLWFRVSFISLNFFIRSRPVIIWSNGNWSRNITLEF